MKTPTIVLLLTFAAWAQRDRAAQNHHRDHRQARRTGHRPPQFGSLHPHPLLPRRPDLSRAGRRDQRRAARRRGEIAGDPPLRLQPGSRRRQRRTQGAGGRCAAEPGHAGARPGIPRGAQKPDSRTGGRRGHHQRPVQRASTAISAAWAWCTFARAKPCRMSGRCASKADRSAASAASSASVPNSSMATPCSPTRARTPMDHSNRPYATRATI